MKVIYHIADLDGKCSAAIVANTVGHKLSKLDFIPMNYDRKFQWDKITPGEKVFLVDFSLQPFHRTESLAEISRLVWIDHHISAIKEYAKAYWLEKDDSGSEKPHIDAYLSPRLAACELTARYFCAREWYLLAKLLGRYDVWDKTSGWEDVVLPFQLGLREKLRNKDTGDPETLLTWHTIATQLNDVVPGNHDIWDALISELLPPRVIAKNETLFEIINIGRELIRKRTQWAKGIMTNAYEAEFEGLRLIVHKGEPGLNSNDFASVYDPAKHDAMACISQHDGIWTVTLFTDKGIDLSEICLARGGGGHKQAAGFQCNTLPKGL